MANATSFDDDILSDGSKAGAVLSLAAAILNAVVLRSMLKHRATLLALQPDSSRLVAIIISMSLLLALQYAAMHIADAAAIVDSIGTIPDILLASASFTTLTVIFSANMLLAFTKYFRIRYDRRLPLTVIKMTLAAGFTFSVFFIASFVPTTSIGGALWTYTPLPLPILFPKVNAQTILFILALCYFFFCAIGIGVFYENSYFLIMAVFQESDVESVLTFPTNPSRTSDTSSPYPSEEEPHVENDLLKMHMTSLMRYIAMSIGFVVFYGPAVVCIITSIFKRDVLLNQWAQFFVRWITPLGPLATPGFAVFCFMELRNVVFEDWRRKTGVDATTGSVKENQAGVIEGVDTKA
ncbi:UNVERIFIED_CONTAM: hypothetical protein HDU68_005472 [Siphonaria sp. JEL0065]|nr:hypothetical protein HDU68_005472 [Siphonaria sp. JEL0065]